MRGDIRISFTLRAAVFVTACIGFLAGDYLVTGFAAHAQVSGGTDINVSKKVGEDRECAIAKNPSNKDQLFVLCNTSTAGLFAAWSTDEGNNWNSPNANKTIADGTDPQIPAAGFDPSLAWDTFGNLFIAYLANSQQAIVVLRQRRAHRHRHARRVRKPAQFRVAVVIAHHRVQFRDARKRRIRARLCHRLIRRIERHAKRQPHLRFLIDKLPQFLSRAQRQRSEAEQEKRTEFHALTITLHLTHIHGETQRVGTAPRYAFIRSMRAPRALSFSSISS